MAGESRIRRILVGFDGSTSSRSALDLALEMARCLDAEILVLSVLPDTSHLETEEDRQAAATSERAALQDGLEMARRRAAQGNLRLVCRALEGGDPAGVIGAFALQHGFDLLVVGDHGRDRATHRGLGRVTTQLLHEPPCPVLVAPEAPAR